jgi:hypothetical protein
MRKIIGIAPYHLETSGAPVHHLDTLPSFGDRKKVKAEKLCRILARAALLTLKPVGHQFTGLPSFDGRKKWRKT